MSRVTITNLEKAYSGTDLFTGLSFEVQPGMRLAVAGPNGCGKSTLLRIVAGEAEMDGGHVSLDRGAQLGYVAQELSDADLEQPLLTWVLTALPSWTEFWREWEQAVAEKNNARIEQLSHRQAEFEEKFGYNPDHKARAILSGLGFDPNDLFKPLRQLSGGWRERAKLGRVLLQGADVLLLDEPTNHLDLEAVEWLENYLLNFSGALIFVAHDRVFLDSVATDVLFLGGGRGTIRRGNFSQFLEWEAEQREQRSREAAKLSARIEHEYKYINKFRVKARKAAQAQSKLKRVSKMEDELEKIQGDQNQTRPGKTLNFRLPETQRCDKVVVGAADLEFHYENGKSVWPKLNFQLYRGKKIALAAPNGAGKTTLLKLLTGDLKPTGGYVKMGGKVQLGYFSQHQAELLDLSKSVLFELRRMSAPNTTEEELMSVLGLFMLGESYFDRPVGALSGGEKNRLILASLFLARANFLILDEPTNHLDLESREGLVRALKDYDGTLLMVAHDRYLMREVAEEVWGLSENGIEVFLGGYQEWHAKCREDAAEECRAEAQPEKRKLTKEDKRRQAEARNKLYREMKPLKSEYEKLEQDLEKAMTQQAEAEGKLNDPSTYESPEVALKLNREYAAATEWADELMEKMAVLEERIEALNAKHAELEQ